MGGGSALGGQIGWGGAVLWGWGLRPQSEPPLCPPHPPQLYRDACECLTLLSQRLGSQRFFFGDSYVWGIWGVVGSVGYGGLWGGMGAMGGCGGYRGYGGYRGSGGYGEL